MEQGLIDIRNKARELSEKFGKWSPYEISCETLIAILDELEASQLKSVSLEEIVQKDKK